LGQISANGFTNGNNDLLLMSLTLSGDTRFVEYMGASIIENPGGILYNQKNDRINIFANTNSISFKNQGGLDWFVMQVDKRGRNQCSSLNIVNLTDTLKFKSSTVEASDKIEGLTFR
jgi:hypothetical protein